MVSEINIAVRLEVETCWCGLPFALPADLRNNARNKGQTIYCPMGHSIVWKDTEETRLRRERDRLQQKLAEKDDEIAEERRRTEAEAKKVKRLERRAKAGTCPCCKRSFSNMAQHMKKQHPAFGEDKPLLKVVS